jgi:ligand-binding sensor domain-containing protein
MKYLRLYFLIACLTWPAMIFAGTPDWEVFFSMHTVRTLIRIGPDLWGASNGGLFRFNLPDRTFQTFTNAEGLSSNDVRAMALDGRGNLILGMGNAYVDMFNLATHQVTSMSDFRSNNKIFQIYDLYNYNGAIYAATDIGVSRLVYYSNLQRYLIQGNYNNLITAHPEIPVQTLRVFGGNLWVGTSQGLARGDLSSTYLESPQAWTTYTTASGLSGINITALEIHRDTLYAAASGVTNGLNRLVDSTFSTLPVPNATGIAFMKSWQDTLYLGRAGGIYRLDGGNVPLLGNYQAKGLTLEYDETGSLWGGFQVDGNLRGGLANFTSSGAWVYYRPEGPACESINDILVEADGSLWLTGRQTAVFYNGVLAHFDGNHWINLTSQDEAPAPHPVSSDTFFHYETKAMTKDLADNLWVGTHGCGVGWFRWVRDTLLEDGSTGDSIFANAYYSSSSGRLFGIAEPQYDPYCVAQDLLTDPVGNVWICNSFAAGSSNAQPLAIVPSAFIQDSAANPAWNYLTPQNTNQNAKYCVDRISQDQFGNKWIGAFNNVGKGARVLDDNGTLESPDDHWYTLTNLPSDSVSCMTLDRDGIMWVGTSAGVRYYYTTQNPQALVGYNLVVPVSQNIRTIAVDPQNNKWFGTAAGISVLAADDYSWLANYTALEGTYPSPLPGNIVNAIAFDPHTGAAYLGTDKGLARLTTPYKETGENVVSVNVWPNPLIIGEGLTDRLNFDMMGMAGDSKVKIFTTSGEMVRMLSTVDVGLGWDGRNSHGKLVGTGVYLILAYSSNGSAHSGKIAVIHQ